MIKIGCNWSNGLKDILKNSGLRVDYVKMGAFGVLDQFALARSFRPTLVHGLGHNEHTGMKDIGPVDFERANRIISECGSPHLGVHLSIMNADMVKGMSEADIFERMSSQIKIFKQKIRVPILLENIPDSPQDRTLFDHFPYAAPEKIRGVIEHNDVGFLLDLTHAKITAQFNHWDIRDYLKALPLNRIKEIHVNGSGYDEQGFPADTHESMKDGDYALLTWILEHSSPEIVTLEYDGIESESEEQVYENLRAQLDVLGKLLS